MVKTVDILSVGLMVLAAIAFSLGIYALGQKNDLASLYWLAVGGLLLKASTDMLKPRAGGR